MTSCRLQSNYSSAVTLHGGPVVLRPMFLVFVVPAQIFELNSITSNENSPATLICKSHGDPAPTMQFRKIGSPHDYNATNVRQASLHEFCLYI